MLPLVLPIASAPAPILLPCHREGGDRRSPGCPEGPGGGCRRRLPGHRPADRQPGRCAGCRRRCPRLIPPSWSSSTDVRASRGSNR